VQLADVSQSSSGKLSLRSLIAEWWVAPPLTAHVLVAYGAVHQALTTIAGFRLFLQQTNECLGFSPLPAADQ
jgi:hypothetical protein